MNNECSGNNIVPATNSEYIKFFQKYYKDDVEFTAKFCGTSYMGNSENFCLHAKKTVKADEFRIATGCGIIRTDVDDCLKRNLPSVIGTGPLNQDQIDEILNDTVIMSEIIFAIEEMQRANNQSDNQEPTEEEKQQALAQQNATGQATWKYTSTGIGYFDFGNGFGWAPPNPKRDKIISGLYVSQRTKNKLMIGSRGRTIFIPR